MKQVILAIDGGGSYTRCLAVTRNGDVVGAGEGGPSNHLLVGAVTVKASFGHAIRAALSQAGLEAADVACLSAGLAGVDHDGAGSGEMEVVLSGFAVENVAVNGDMVVAHVGALACEPGVVALAGTGSSILGIAGDGRRAKVGGWGPIFGDEGSANGIAQDCLRAAARCFDGRGGETALLEGLTKILGLSDFSESVERIYLGRMETREIAALCRRAYEIAANGDETAIGIFRRAGEQLALGVEAALRRLGMADIPSKVSYQGSVLESCTIVRERFSERLGEECPKASIMPPRFKPVIGAFLIGCQAVGWSVDGVALEKLENVVTAHE